MKIIKTIGSCDLCGKESYPSNLLQIAYIEYKLEIYLDGNLSGDIDRNIRICRGCINKLSKLVSLH